MHLLSFKRLTMGWLMLYISIGFLPLAFGSKLINPFFLTPENEVEKYNYVAGLVHSIQPAILLFVLYSCISYLSQVNIDSALNNWIKVSFKDVSRVVMALLLYQFKELLDYMVFENVVPECFSPFWFLFFWELLPIVMLMVWATTNTRKIKK
jgi:hypothetical protein